MVMSFFMQFRHLRGYVDGKILWLDHYDFTHGHHCGMMISLRNLDENMSGEGVSIVIKKGPSWRIENNCTWRREAHTNVICSIVDRVKNMVVYIDHEVIVGTCDGVANPQTEMPKMINLEIHHRF